MKKRMCIVANYSDDDESYGLLGPQMTATIIRDNTAYDCVVVAVGHNIGKDAIKRNILELTGADRPVVGFSNVGGRTELWEVAGELRAAGAITILGGPQANVDFTGEVAWQKYPHRFHGLSDSFTYALHGPSEQLIPFLKSGFTEPPENIPGLSYKRNGIYYANASAKWNSDYLRKVDWDNLYRMASLGLEKVNVSCAQVLQQIGCPYAARTQTVSIDYPTHLQGAPFKKKGQVSLDLRGCSFCDVARDKGFVGNLPLEAVLTQINNLPEDASGRKIPFELISEAPVQNLPQLLAEVEKHGVRLSQINLVGRADWLVKDKEKLRGVLALTQRLGIRILLSTVGFESFSDTILRNLTKGCLVSTNLAAIELIRELKREFPHNWFYSTADGANHGFIHPTPWDSAETENEIRTNIFVYGLQMDIMPAHSIPLIIHHACGLADWIRELEAREGLSLNRLASIIEWW